MRSVAVLFVCATALAVPERAAAQAYLVEETEAAYEPLAEDEGTTLAIQGDSELFEVALPFPFRFFSREYDKVYVSVNGGVTFAGRDGVTGQTRALPDQNVAVPSTAQPQALIAVVWDDWKANGHVDGVSSRVAWATRDVEDGEDSHRAVVIDWQQMQRHGSEGEEAPTYSFQLWLHEGTDQYELRFGPTTGTVPASLDATSGAENHLGTVGVAHRPCNPVCGVIDFFPAPSLLVSPNLDAELTIALSKTGVANGGPNIEVVVQNLGLSEAEGVYFEIYLSRDATLDPNDTLLYTLAEPETLAARPAEFRKLVNVPMPEGESGLRYLIGKIVSLEPIPEQNKANNVAALDRAFLAGIDLRVETFGQAAADVAGPSTYNVRLLNGGVRDATDVRFSILLMGGPLTTTRTIYTSDPVTVPGEGATLVNVVFTMPGDLVPGDYRLDTHVDPQNEIVEVDETNNRLPERLDVQLRGADLEATRVSAGQTIAYQGLTMPIEFTLTNRGSAPAEGFLYGLYLSRGNDTITRQDTRIFLSEPVTLGPREGRLFRDVVTIPSSLPPGEYWAGVIVDAAERVGEVDRTNNIAAAGQSVIIAPPIADVVAAAIASQPAAAAGASVRVSLVLSNTGTHAGTFEWGVYLSDNELASPHDARIGSGTVTLEAGGQQALSFDASVPPTLRPGPYRLVLIADPNGIAVDADRTNNVLVAPEPLEVLPPGLRVLNTTLPDALVGAPYEVTLGTSGGTSTVKWRLAAGDLPEGLSFNEAGRIAGTPTVPVVAPLVVEASSADVIALQALTLSVRAFASSLGLLDTHLPTGRRGAPYDVRLGASGGTGLHTFEKAAGDLPPGLTLAADGRISGYPITTDVYAFTVQVRDQAGQRASGEMSIQVVASGALRLTSSRLRDAEVGRAYLNVLPIDGGEAPYTVSLASGALPAGLSLELDDSGVAVAVEGTPRETGVFAFTAALADARGERTMEHLVLQVTPQRLAFLTTALPVASVGAPYQALIETNAQPPYSYSLAGGELPNGLVLDPSGLVTGSVPAGTPPRLYAFAVRIADGAGGSALGAFSIEVPAPPLPEPSSGCATGDATSLAALLVLGLLLSSRRRTASFAALVLALAAAAPANAYYRVTRSSEPYVPFPPFAEDETRQLVLEPAADQTSSTTRGQAVLIPFPFKFYGVEQTVAGILTKGMISFGSLHLNWSRDELQAIPAMGGPSQFVAPMWSYIMLSTETPTTPSVVSWRLEGEAPRRVMAIEWHNIQRAGFAPPYRGDDWAAYSFQVRLHEGTNDITFHYGGDAVLLGRTPPLAFAMGLEGRDGVEGVDASDVRCSPGCSAANFPMNQVIRFNVVPDLSIAHIESPPALFSGVGATIRTVVANGGDTDASRTRVRFFLSKDRFIDANDIVLGETAATTIVATASATISTQVMVPDGTEPGLYHLLARVDPTNEIIELDETNNDYAPIQTLVLERAPDFAPVRLSAPSSVDAGHPLTITRTIRNLGNASGSGTYRVVLSANSLVSAADLVLEEGTFTLAPGETLDASPSLNLPAGVTPGPYHVGLLVRPASGQPEIDPLNNDRVVGPVLVRGDALAITRDTLPTVAAGVPFSVQLTAGGGAGGYAWKTGFPAPPPGVQLSSGGVLTGQVELTGEWPFQVLVSSGGATVSRTFVLRSTGVTAPLSIVSRRLPIAQLAAPYEGHLLAQGGTPPYEWELVAPSVMPAGLQLASDGVVEGAPTGDGQTVFHVRVRDAAGASAEGEVALGISGPTRPLFASASLPAAQVGVPYSATLRAAGGVEPYRYSVVDARRVALSSVDAPAFYVGELPPGLTLSQDGEIEGTPTFGGVFIVTLRVVDAQANDASTQLALAVSSGTTLEVRTRALPDAVLGEAYEATLTAAGAAGDVRWEAQVIEGASGFPAGIALGGDGRISGMPLAMGQVSFLAIARDATGQIAIQPLALRVIAPPPAPEKTGGCDAVGASGLAAVLGLLALGRRRRRSSPGALLSVPLVALLLAAAGCTPSKPSACPEGCEAPYACDERDGLCKCGGSGGAVCTAGESCEPTSRSCLASTCETGCEAPLVCGEGGTCRCGTVNGPVCADDEECSAFGRCEKRSRCEGVVCGVGMTCDETTGACTCGPGGETCGAGERCVDAECVSDRCAGVSCSGGTACDPADGLCKCGGAGGAVCTAGEACAPGEARCVRSSFCDDVTCALGSACDPADGLCKCGGVGGPRCADEQTCDPLAKRCLGGDQCAGVTCSDSTSCDPEDGVCKCGGFGGAVCDAGERCIVLGPQASCELPCDVLANDCGAGLNCAHDPSFGFAWCKPAGTATVGQGCGEGIATCAAGLHCVLGVGGASGTCRSYCRPTTGCATGFLCFPFQVGDDVGACLPLAP